MNTLKTPKSKELFLSQMEIHYWEKCIPFPMVFYEKNFIGGCIDIENYIKSINKLKSNKNLIFESDY